MESIYYLDYYTNRNKLTKKVKHFNDINECLLFCYNNKYIDTFINFENDINKIVHDRNNIIKYLESLKSKNKDGLKI